jgi:hypothetical protein
MWDTANETPLHPFTEAALIEALEELREVLNDWHTFRGQEFQPDHEMMMHGRDVMQALPKPVIVAREIFQRRKKEIVREERMLAKSPRQAE